MRDGKCTIVNGGDMGTRSRVENMDRQGGEDGGQGRVAAVVGRRLDGDEINAGNKIMDVVRFGTAPSVGARRTTSARCFGPWPQRWQAERTLIE